MDTMLHRMCTPLASKWHSSLINTNLSHLTHVTVLKASICSFQTESLLDVPLSAQQPKISPKPKPVNTKHHASCPGR